MMGLKMVGDRTKKILGWWRKLSPIKWLYLLAILIIVQWLLHIRVGVEFDSEFWVQVILSFGIVIVAVLSVNETRKIRELTREQVEEMRKERQSAFMPILIAQCTPYSSSKPSSGVQVALRNIGPGPALDIGVTITEELPIRIENAWKGGKTAVNRVLAFNLSELASGHDSGEILKQPSYAPSGGQEFLIVIECSDVNKNTIGSYRGFRIPRFGAGGKVEVTQTVPPQRIKHRVRSYKELNIELEAIREKELEAIRRRNR